MLRIFLLIILLLNVSVYSQDEEAEGFRLGEKNWVYAGNTNSGEASFIPQGEDPKNWQEVIVFYHIPAGDIPLHEYYQTFMKILNQRSNNLFESRAIQSEKDSLLFEWWTIKEAPKKQQGLVKITKIPSGLKFFRYTTRNEQDGEDLRRKWEPILANTEFEMTPSQVEIFIPWDLDSRKWDLTIDTPNYYEYLPKESDKNNWKERVAVHLWSTLPLPLSDFYTLLTNDLKRRYGESLEHKIIELSDTTLFFEWEVPKGPDAMREWYKVQIVGPELAVVTRYTTKKLDDEEKTQTIWKHILENSSVNASYHYQIIPDSWIPSSSSKLPGAARIEKNP